MGITFLVGSYNDLDLSKKMYPSLVASLDTLTNFGWGLLCVDGGSTDGSIEWWSQRCPTISPKNDQLLRLLGRKGEDLQHLSVALNAGIEYALMGGADYVCHIHPDMLFPEKGWERELMNFIKRNPKAGKTAADDISIKGGTRAPANQCPWMMSKEVIQKHIEVDGFVFDEAAIGIGGLEDHDLCRRQLLMGYAPVICGTSLVDHNGGEGMGTRSRRDTNPEGFYNRHWYANKYPDTCLHNWSEKIEDFWSDIEWK